MTDLRNLVGSELKSLPPVLPPVGSRDGGLQIEESLNKLRMRAPQSPGFDVLKAVVEQKVFLNPTSDFGSCTVAAV